MENPLTLAWIEPATLPFVAQHLNHWSPYENRSRWNLQRIVSSVEPRVTGK